MMEITLRFNPVDDKDVDIADQVVRSVKQFNSDRHQQSVLPESDNSATGKQIWKLKSLGYVGDASKLSKLEASDEIKKLEGK